jgi:transposase
VVIEVEIYEDIRKLTIEGMSQRAIAKKLGISRQTVKKYGEGETIPGNRKSYNRQPGVISPEVIRFIQSCFDADAVENLSKQKHTAKRIYSRLVKEMDFNGGESTIRAIVSSLRSNYTVPPQAMMPLSYAPGEAMQIDWVLRRSICMGKRRNSTSSVPAYVSVAISSSLLTRLPTKSLSWKPSSLPSTISEVCQEG